MFNNHHYLKNYTWLLILVLEALPHHLCTQNINQNDLPGKSLEIFAEAFALKSDSSGKGRLDVYVQIPYPEICFVKKGEFYTGRFELSATVQTQEKQELWQKNQIVELQLKDFAHTISHRLSSLKQFSTDLPPGNYDLLLRITDYESKKIFTLQKSVVVKDFGSDSLAISDLMLVHRTNVDSTRKSIVPNLTETLAQGLNGFSIFFEIYTRAQLDSSQLLCKFINSKNEVIVQRAKSEVLSGSLTPVVWKIDTPALPVDRYMLLIEIVGYSHANPSSHLRTSGSRRFFVRPNNVPLTITDIDKATDQLLYIANGVDLDYIRGATTSEEKQKRFLEFWAKRDPDPKTPDNELMEEFYARVSYANKNYSHYIEGWKTDRGMVLIKFGLPQHVERHPFDSDSKPYEIWYYYDQNREFVFVDETGFGDYRLRYPETDLWGRIR